MVTIVTNPESCAGMQPEIMPGDTVCIDPSEKTGENGIYLVEYKGKQKFCRLTTTACGKWLIFSNPVYRAEFVPLEESDTLKIHAKVIKQIREY